MVARQGLRKVIVDAIGAAGDRDVVEVVLADTAALAANRVSFGLESTLAARSLVPRLRDLIIHGYEFHLVFLYLPSADLAVARVANRVRLGGHNVPELTIRRRYESGLKNFFSLYQPIATSWPMYDNSRKAGLDFVAEGRQTVVTHVARQTLWKRIERSYRR